MKRIIYYNGYVSHLNAKVAERLRNRLQMRMILSAGSKRFYSGSNPDLGLALFFLIIFNIG